VANAAREYVESNAAAAYFADVAIPAGANSVSSWSDDGDDWLRTFDGAECGGDEDARVDIGGVQWSDGRIERDAYVEFVGGPPVRHAGAQTGRAAAGRCR
jgi:hypothetical protein